MNLRFTYYQIHYHQYCYAITGQAYMISYQLMSLRTDTQTNTDLREYHKCYLHIVELYNIDRGTYF